MSSSWQARRDCWLVPSLVAVAAGCALVAAGQRVSLPRGPSVGGLDQGITDDAVVPALAITQTAALGPENEARERLRLLDPTPLFMPGNWAVERGISPKALADRPGGEVAATISPALKFPEIHPTRGILTPRPAGTPREGAAWVVAPRWFRGLGRTDAILPETEGTVVSPSGLTGRVDVYRLGTSFYIGAINFDSESISGDVPWRPVELIVLVDAAGEVVSPMVKTSSGVESVDEKLRELTRTEWVVRLALRPGHYRFMVGP